MSVNTVVLIGHLATDPEFHTIDGNQVTELFLTTFEKGTSFGGSPQERTEWHRVVFPGWTEDRLTGPLLKGDLIFVEGKMHSLPYEAPEGSTVFLTTVVAKAVALMDRPDEGPSEEQWPPVQRHPED